MQSPPLLNINRSYTRHHFIRPKEKRSRKNVSPQPDKTKKKKTNTTPPYTHLHVYLNVEEETKYLFEKWNANVTMEL